MTVTTDFKTDAFAQDTSEAVLVLVTISHDDLAAPIRVVNNTVDVTSNGDTHTAFPFDVRLPDSREDAPSQGQLTIDNVSREVAEAIRSISTAPDVSISIIRASDPDTVEQSHDNFKLRNVKWDAAKVTGDLVLDDYTNEPYPAHTFTPASFPGIF